MQEHAMSKREVVNTSRAPAAIGPYSQAVKVDKTVYLSGQIPLVPETMTLAGIDIATQALQVFDNLAAVCQAAGGSLRDIVKLNIYLTDLGHFHEVNEVMKEKMSKPYPARAAIGVNQLPKDSLIEMDAIMVI